MPDRNIFSFRSNAFNDFLFAEVQTDANETFLTVQSMIARLDRDPWEEAGILAELSHSDAVGRLAQCIIQMKLNSVPSDTARTRAVRLIKLLPGRHALPWTRAKQFIERSNHRLATAIAKLAEKASRPRR